MFSVFSFLFCDFCGYSFESLTTEQDEPEPNTTEKASASICEISRLIGFTNQFTTVSRTINIQIIL